MRAITARARVVPAPASTAWRLRITWWVCATVPPATSVLVRGSTPSWPVTNRYSPARTAWLYAAVGGGGGAAGKVRNSSSTAGPSRGAGLALGRRGRRRRPRAGAARPAPHPGHEPQHGGRELGVEAVADAVAQQVEGEHGHGDGETGEDNGRA